MLRIMHEVASGSKFTVLMLMIILTHLFSQGWLMHNQLFQPMSKKAGISIDTIPILSKTFAKLKLSFDQKLILIIDNFETDHKFYNNYGFIKYYLNEQRITGFSQKSSYFTDFIAPSKIKQHNRQTRINLLNFKIDFAFKTEESKKLREKQKINNIVLSLYLIKGKGYNKYEQNDRQTQILSNLNGNMMAVRPFQYTFICQLQAPNNFYRIEVLNKK